jgi:amino acid transporter
MSEINGLPIGFFVIAGGIIVVLSSWVLMRFGKIIARAVLVVAALVIGAIVALAVLAQGAASVQTATAAKKTAQVAQTTATGNLLLVGAVGCVGGFALLAVVVALGIAGVFWYKAHLAERDRDRARITTPRPQALPEPQQTPVVWVMGDGQHDAVDLSKVDFSRWGW